MKTSDEYCVDTEMENCHAGDRHTPFRDCSDIANIPAHSPCYDQGVDENGNPVDTEVYYQFWEEECSITCVNPRL